VTVTEQIRESERSPLADSEVAYLIVYVTDIARSRKFYEGTLGLRPLEASDTFARYDTGAVRLWLRRAIEDDIALPSGTDDSCDIVFLVDDAKQMRAALERRGLEIAHQRTYGVGTVVDFYDPDGHRLMAYEVSEHAMTTPVADNLRDMWSSTGRGAEQSLIGEPATTIDEADLVEKGLDGKPLSYFFLFIHDLHSAADFFERQLGLDVLDRSHCCSDHCPDDEPGVVKYDGGPIIVSTHHLHGHHSVLDDEGRPYAAREYDPWMAKGVAAVFAVDEIEGVVDELERRGVRFRDGIVRSEDGCFASFEAPSGHLLCLYEAAKR
jgi:catechol 2,3-dioxygenase-like lactoylglutathione lyase family enzyme